MKYRPLGLSCDKTALNLAEVLRDEAQRKEMPLRVTEARWTFLECLGQEAQLELALRVAPIDYCWRLGRVERLGR